MKRLKHSIVEWIRIYWFDKNWFEWYCWWFQLLY